MTPTPAGEPPPIGPGRRDFLGLEYNFDHCWGKIGKNGEFHFSGVPAETVSLMFMVTYPYKISPRNASGDTAGYRLLGRVVTNKTDLVIEFEPNAQPQKSAPLDYQALSQKPLRGVEAGERPPAATNQTNVETSIAPNPSTEWTGTILLPNGQPAAGAQVGFAAANEAIRLKGSRLSRSTGDEAPIASTDAQGRFSLPLMESANSMDSADSLIAAHDGGYFKIEKQDLKVPLLIRLEAWGRIEGTLHVGKRPGANEAILLSMATGSPSSPKLDTSDSWRKTGVGGRFVFEHVPPGKVRLCHMIRFGNGGGNSSGYTLARVKPGNVTKVEMGGDGRQVIGKAVKDSGVAFDWDQAVVQLHGPSPYQPDQPQFFCGPITDDGSFRVDDVPAGSYTLTINVSSHRRDSRVIELGIVPAPLFTKDVKVPEVSDRRSDTPVDLGTLHIGSATNNAPSNPPSAVQPSSRGSSNELSAINQAIVLPKALAAKPNLTNAASGPSSSSKPAINSLGLTLEIRCTTNVLKVGDEIPIEFTISNHGTEDYKYPDRTYDRSGRMPEYELTAKTASGESVPDPRVHFKPFGMGGLFQYGVLHPGESFSKIIALNLWALIKEPGQYEVVGIYARDDYRNDPIVPVKSDPISITVLPRSKEEMNDYIQGLTHQLGAEDSVKKLMYTCSPASISTLLSILCQPNAGNGNERFWATAALEDYMPRTEESRKAILEAATKYRFLNGNGFEQVLMAYDFNNKEMKPIIERALAVDNSGEWGAGVWLALRYYDAAFTLRLIAIAGDPNARGDTRSIAMRVLTSNRTDAGVKAIKALLKDPAQEMLRPLFETIANGYSGQGTATNGRPLQAEDFSAEDLKPLIERLLASTNQALQLQLSGVTLAKQFGSDALTAQLVALSTNPSPYISAGAIYALALNRTDEGVKTLKTLLNDSDPKVSKMAEEAIRNAYISRGDARGRPLRADDFEAKFREPEATPAK
jgi:hypothetical protein